MNRIIYFTRLSIVLIVSIVLTTFVEGQTKENVNYVKPRGVQEKINWYTIEEVNELSKTNKKKVLVDLYTDWCGWCKVMDKKTFSDEEVIRYVNENYYPVKFNAESKESITFLNKDYNYVSNGSRGYNELAIKLAQGQLSFPTIIFLDEQLNIIQPVPGYQEQESFLMIARYFAENKYKDTPWSVYQKNYKSQ